MKNYSIGIAGLASYATIDIAKRIIDQFPAEKEWDRPRIVIDNDCRIPSRVRAILFNEKREEVITMMVKQIKYLSAGGVDRIIIGCNTAHYFLPFIQQYLTEDENQKIINIIINLRDFILSKYGQIDVGLLASEGVYDTKIYHEIMGEKGITVHSVDEREYVVVREMIEDVKQNKVSESTINKLKGFLDNCKQEYVILGCTELPVIYDAFLNAGFITKKEVLDPIGVVIQRFKEEWMLLND